MGELYEPYPKLPKNIRQIGERDDIVRVYLEDYVNTYLKRLFPAGGQDLRAGLLLGNAEDHGGVPYVFIDGALEMEQVTEEGEKVSFTEEAWKKAYQAMEEMFPKRTVQGWFLCGAPGCMLSPLNYWKQHSQYFSGKHKLMYLNSGLEGEEALYITSSDGFYKLRGHCVYYERNQMMQDYMVLRKDNRRVEAGGSDPVIRDFRRKMEQKKELASSQSHTIGFLKSMCGCLAILAMAGGVAAFNSAEKMKDMEAVMASVLPDADAVSTAGTAESGAVIIEEASGGVFPTAAPEEEDHAAAGPFVLSGAAAAGQAPAVQAGGSPGTGGNRSENRTGGEGSVNPAGTGDGTGAEAPAGTGNGTGAEAPAGTGNGIGAEAPTGTGNTTGAEDSAETGSTTGAETPAGAGNGTGTGGASGTENPTGAEGAAGAGNGGGSEQPAGTGNTAAAQKSSASARQLEPAPGQSVYVVQEGETLYGICFKFYQNLSKVDEICRINGLEDVNLVEAGRRLIMP